MVEMATRYIINLSEEERLGLEDLLSLRPALVLLQRSWPKKVACAIGVHELRAGQGRHATVAGLL